MFVMKKFLQILGVVVRIIFFVLPVAGVIIGAVAHGTFGMNFAVCAAIGGVIGLILAAEVVLVGAVLLSIVCGLRPSDFKFSTFKKLRK